MKTRVKEKDTTQIRDKLQDELEDSIAELLKLFFDDPTVKKFKLTGYSVQDITAGALITVFTKGLAFTAAQEGRFDHETYLQKIFDSMSHLFAKCREKYAEVLKDKDEKNSSGH